MSFPQSKLSFGVSIIAVLLVAVSCEYDCSPNALFSFSPLIMGLEKEQMAPVLISLPPTPKTPMKFLTLAWPVLTVGGHLGSEQADGRSLPLSQSPSLSLSFGHLPFK